MTSAAKRPGPAASGRLEYAIRDWRTSAPPPTFDRSEIPRSELPADDGVRVVDFIPSAADRAECEDHECARARQWRESARIRRRDSATPVSEVPRRKEREKGRQPGERREEVARTGASKPNLYRPAVIPRRTLGALGVVACVTADLPSVVSHAFGEVQRLSNRASERGRASYGDGGRSDKGKDGEKRRCTAGQGRLRSVYAFRADPTESSLAFCATIASYRAYRIVSCDRTNRRGITRRRLGATCLQCARARARAIVCMCTATRTCVHDVFTCMCVCPVRARRCARRRGMRGSRVHQGRLDVPPPLWRRVVSCRRRSRLAAVDRPEKRSLSGRTRKTVHGFAGSANDFAKGTRKISTLLSVICD